MQGFGKGGGQLRSARNKKGRGRGVPCSFGPNVKKFATWAQRWGGGGVVTQTLVVWVTNPATTVTGLPGNLSVNNKRSITPNLGLIMKDEDQLIANHPKERKTHRFRSNTRQRNNISVFKREYCGMSLFIIKGPVFVLVEVNVVLYLKYSVILGSHT